MQQVHNINEDYGNWIKRMYLRERRKLIAILVLIIFFGIVFLGFSLFEKGGFSIQNNAGLFQIIMWIFIIAGIYLAYKFFRKMSIPKKKWTNKEMSEVDE
jgi:membrane protease YdiL (CAAX protease family)